MDSLDFNFVVIPLAIIIGILFSLVIFYSKKKERTDESLDSLKSQMLLSELDRKTFAEKVSNLEANEDYKKGLHKLKLSYEKMDIDLDTFLRLWQVLAYSKMTQAGSRHVSMSADGTSMSFWKARGDINTP